MASGLRINDQRVTHDLIAKMPAEIHGSSQIDPASAEQAAQRLLNFRKPEEANSLLGPKFDQDIDVAGISEPFGDHGAEQGEFTPASDILQFSAAA
jgi:hypothetical protein